MPAGRRLALLLAAALLAATLGTASARADSSAELAISPNVSGPTGSPVSPDTCTTCISSGGPIVLLASNSNVPADDVTVTPPSGAAVTAIQLQYAPDPQAPPQYALPSSSPQILVPTNHSAVTAQPYTAQVTYSNFNGAPSGWYDVQAIVTTAGGTVTSNSVRVVVDNDQGQDAAGNFLGTYIGMQNLPQFVSGSIPLVAACEQAAIAVTNQALCPQQGFPGLNPASMTFWKSPQDGSGADTGWTRIGTAAPEFKADGVTQVVDSSSMQEYAFNPPTGFDTDTATTPDGTYDLTVTADDSPPDKNTYLAAPVTVAIDNTPPTVALSNPGSLGGTAELSATASVKPADAALGVGIAAVTFYYAAAGTGAWTPIGLSTNGPPYQKSFSTQSLPNGLYDLRAVATDSAGNTATSVVSSVAIDNPLSASFDVANLRISTMTAPASNVTLLGDVTGGPDQGTWAYGTTTALPPTVGGAPLYSYPVASGTEQLVVLHHTDSAGWQIAGALDSPDGSAFPAGANGVRVTGQMTASGEGWIVVTDGKTPEVFYHRPGGSFAFDQGDTDALADLLTIPRSSPTSIQQNPPTLELGQTSSGQVYGTIVTRAKGKEYGELSPANCNSGQTVPGETSCWSIQPLPAPTQTSGGSPTSADALQAISPTGLSAGTVTGWGEFNNGNPQQPLLLAQLGAGGAWGPFVKTGLDPLDLTGKFAGPAIQVQATGILAASDGVWIEATLSGALALSKSPNTAGYANVVALYDPSTHQVEASRCTPALLALESFACDAVIDANHPATLPDAVVDGPSGPVALGLANGFIDAYAAGAWSQVAAPGFTAAPGAALFTDADDGWLAGPNAVGRVSTQVSAPRLAQWPEANQATLTSVALPTAGAGIGTSGALTVGLDGAALHYDSTNGWLVDAVPARAQGRNLLGVAYDGPSRAVAVGDFGTILDWNGTNWSADPQSGLLTQNQLNAVAFGAGGQGWAVGNFGTILHFDGTAWSAEQIDAADSGENVTSVAVAGNDVFAIAGGNLLERNPGGGWQEVHDCGVGTATASCLPGGVQGSLTLVSGLPDGGAAVAGDSIVLLRQNPSASFQPAPQPIQGTAVALSAFRDPGQVRAFVSVAPPVQSVSGRSLPVGGLPAGDGELLVETGSGWDDLSQAQNPSQAEAGRGQEGPEPDPVLAVAAAPDGAAAWAVGGYAGTQTAAGLGTTEPLQARSSTWQTSSIWRFDAGGGAQPPTLSQGQVSIPAQPDTVNFAFFSDAECDLECASVSDPQPMVNLGGATGEIGQYAAQPGGPAFAILGGNVVGPSDSNAYSAGTNATADFANLPQYLSPLGSVPLYGAFGQLDQVPTEADPARLWNDAFQGAPAPFGAGGAPSGITPVDAGGLDGSVNHYYVYDVAQNGGTLRVIVLDNSAGSLDASAAGQSAWLSAQLSAARAGGVPVVVVCSEPLASTLPESQPPSVPQGPVNDADGVATELADAGVLAVFTSSPNQLDTMHMIPSEQPGSPPSAQPQIPEYEGAAVGYQQSQNNGVLWYFVSVDTATDTVSVQGIPVVQSLALEPLSGLTAPRSSTLSFQAVGRRPAGSLLPGDNPEGIANYVSIPAPSCSGCVPPSYKFKSSDPVVGDFVQPSGPGSRLPKLSASGNTTPSSASGLFCAFNAGTTKVSVTSGLLTSSLTVTVRPGQIGQPCGTVPDANAATRVVVPGKTIVSSAVEPGANPAGAAPPPAGGHPVAKSPSINAPIPKPVPTPKPAPPSPAPKPAPPSPAPKPAPQPPPSPAPAPAKSPTPQPAPKPTTPASASKPATSPAPPQPAPAPPAVQPPFIAQPSPLSTAPPPVIFPPIPLPVTTVPPGGATVPGQATARREERARKHARQSAYVTRPAGTSADEWFYPAVGVMTVFALLLISNGIRVGPKPRLALAENRVTTDSTGRRRRR